MSLCSSGFLAARVSSLLFTVYGFVSFNYCEVPRCSGGQCHKHLGSKYITKCTRKHLCLLPSLSCPAPGTPHSTKHRLSWALRGRAGLQGTPCSHCSGAVLCSSTLKLQLHQHHPCSERRPSAPGASWIRLSPFLPHCRPRACKSGSRSASLHLFFFSSSSFYRPSF